MEEAAGLDHVAVLFLPEGVVGFLREKKNSCVKCIIETANSRGTFFVEGAVRLPVLTARRSINLRERESRGVQEVCPKLGVQNERDS
jgi:hypothetical protein